MHSTGWRRAIKQAAKEFQLTKLQVIEGSIPKSLNGSLYRNAPGCLERGGETMGHWFDGDGVILGVHFNNGEARGVQKYVQTEGFQKEEAANKRLYASYGLSNPGPFLNRLTGVRVKNVANTSVLPLPDKLLALWEGGWPHSLDLETLETIRIDDLGFLEKENHFSAHPKVDPVTGEIYNIGNKSGREPYLCLFKCDKNGKKIAETKVPHRINMVHDFILAGRYIVVMSFPTEVQGLLAFLLGFKSYNEVLKWNPSLGTEVFIFDRNNLSLVSKFKTDPFYAFHFTNGYEEKDGSIYVEFAKYNTYADVNELLTGIPNLSKTLDHTLAGRLTYMRIDPKQGKMTEMKQIADAIAEFPSVADAHVGDKWQYSLFASATEKEKDKEAHFNTITQYDHKGQNLHSYFYGKDRYVSEPLLISSEKNPEHGHILAVVYDANADRSELWVHDNQNLEKDPLCRIALPEVVPPGFHGRWKQN